MSNDVHNILDAISEAKAALDAKPTLERRIRELENQLNDAQRHSQGLEENIIGYKANIEEIKAENTRLGDELLNAQLHSMELEDRIHSVSGFLSSMRDSVTTMDRTINPQPIEPTPPTVEQPVPPTVSTPEPAHTEAQPIEPMAEHTTPVPSLTYESGYEAPVEHKPEPKAQPYTTRLYYFCRDYMPLSQWIAGGGTEYAYYWRPQRVGNDEIQAPVGYSTERFEVIS